MNVRLTKFLPRFPAVLLVPVALVVWVAVWTTPRGEDRWGHVYRGFPFVFTGSWEVGEMDPQDFAEVLKNNPQIARWYSMENLPIEGQRPTGFQINWFLLDLFIALATAYIVAMAVDRLLYPMIRAFGMKRRGSGETA